ncbi:MAG: hypothetical protein JWR69_456 [Pedosphaera sp.]|nr:hypothetical protein [Pedosphaera sp.]
MNSNWAADNLQAIRTLMERSAIYRRALAPVMTFTGLVGILAALIGAWLNIVKVPAFTKYWMGVSLLAIAGDYVLVRRQALKESEPFWSPPTRRVTQALLPALFVGMIVGVVFIRWVDNPEGTVLLPTIWMLLYGCALHAAGFFMPRGIRLFAWLFLVVGAGIFLGLQVTHYAPRMNFGHVLMGFFFGGVQLAYGIYLYFTEQRKNEA